MRLSKSEILLNKIKERTGGELKISMSGVPHLVIGTYSVCYFGKKKSFRIFSGYRTPQNRAMIDFRDWTHVANWFETNTGYRNTHPKFS